MEITIISWNKDKTINGIKMTIHYIMIIFICITTVNVFTLFTNNIMLIIFCIGIYRQITFLKV